MSSRIGITQWGVVIIFGSLGLALLMVAAFIQNYYQATLAGAVLLSIAISFLSTIVVFICDRFVPRAEARVQVKRGHEEIYEKYRSCLESLPKGESHEIRAVSSSPPSPGVAEKWDNFLVHFLKDRSNDVIYKRVIITNKSDEWKRRRRDLETRYIKGKLTNYRQFETEGPPSIECLLIEDSLVFVTFASVGKPLESFCLQVKDRKVYKEFEKYFDNQLLQICSESRLSVNEGA